MGSSQITFTTHYYGTDDTAHVELDVADLRVTDLPADKSGATDPVPLRVRASGLTAGDVAKLRNTNWDTGRFTDPRSGQAIAGRLSALEYTSDDELEFIINPAV